MDVGTAVGVASLGIQVCQGLVQYYDGWKDAPADVAGTLDCVKSLSQVFDSLRTILRSNQLDLQATANVEKHLKECTAGVESLSRKYSKIQSSNKFKNEALRLFYPFKISTLTKIKETVADLIGQLQLALEVLDLAESTKFQAIVRDAVRTISSNIAVIETNIKDIKGDIKAVSNTTSQISKTADSIHNLSYQIDQTTLHIDQQSFQIKADTSSIADQAGRQRRKALLDWLSPEDFSKQHDDFMGRRQEGSGKWFLQDPKVSTWLNSTNDTLLCEGDPGVGKTILAAVVIDHLLKTAHGSATPVVFIYCNYRRSDDYTCNFLLRSLLRQVVDSRMIIAQHIYDLEDSCGSGKRTLSLPEVRQALALTARCLSRLTVVIDAIDECSRDVATLLMSSLTDLRNSCPVKIMATSRPLVRAMADFTHAVSLTITASDEDIEHYIRARMVELPGRVRANAQLQDEIVRAMKTAVEGVFLLAQLNMDSLKDKMTIKKLRDALLQLPQGSNSYDAAYNEAMARVHGQQQGYCALATQVFSWMVCARRPLSMSELQHVLAVESGDTNFDEENIPSVDDILLACVGLVTIDDQSNDVRLVHYTAQQYFERMQDKWLPHADVKIARTCITYLRFDVFACGRCATRTELEQRLQHFAFLDYAALHWAEHFHAYNANGSNAGRMDLQEAALQFLASQGAVRSCAQVTFYQQRDFDGYYWLNGLRRMRGIHLIAEAGLDDLLRMWIARKGAIDPKGYDGRSPLSLAAESGHIQTAAILLGTGKVNADSRDGNGRTPLSWAAAEGCYEVVKLLLTCKADADSKDDRGRTPISYAAEEGWYDVVELLLDTNEVKEDPEVYRGQTPLSFAVQKGHYEVVELLLQKGKAEVDSVSVNGMTPLAWAADCGNREVVELLLRNNASVDLADNVGRTPLWVAALEGNEEVAETLLRGRADVNAQDVWGQTPLFQAVLGRHASIVELLLQHGANPNVEDQEGNTPMSWARNISPEDVVEILLRHGARDYPMTRSNSLSGSHPARSRPPCLYRTWSGSRKRDDLDLIPGLAGVA